MEIKNKYIIKDKLGNGKFGIVYLGIYKKTNEKVAIKTENMRTPMKLLKHETTMLKYLYEHGSRNVPIIYWYGIHADCTCLVMSYYEKSLADHIKTKELNIGQIDKIILQMIVIMENIHKNLVVHRDIKPQNFMLKDGELFLIDFGLATFYVNENEEHIEQSSHESILGTPKYISPNIHQGITPSRRDDLISIGYIYIFLVCRELPWDSITTNPLDETIHDELSILHYKNIARQTLKSWENIEPICNKIDVKLLKYMNYCYQLKYKDVPNYMALKECFGLGHSAT
jgi:serine/threonine protein kinase